MDLKAKKIRKKLHPIDVPNNSGTYLLPSAVCNMSKQEKEMFLQVLKELKLPKGFSSRIAKQVNVQKRKIIVLKSHDYHVLMEHVLPLALRTSVKDEVGLVLNDYCTFFRELCSRNIDIRKVVELEKRIPLILCKLEQIFPPSSFDIMTHEGLGAPSQKTSLLGGVAQILIYPRPSSPRLVDVGLFVSSRCGTICSTKISTIPFSNKESPLQAQLSSHLHCVGAARLM